jgi:hypothetical protein
MRKLLSSVCVAAAITFSGAAQAVVLIPGFAIPLPGTSVASDPSLAGPVVQDIMTPFNLAGGFATGQVESSVVLAADGTYDFYWRVFNDPTSTGPVGVLRIGNFLTSSYDANYRTDLAGNLAPLTASLFASPPGSINWAFYDLGNPNATQALEPGQSSMFMFLDTNATSFAQTALLDVATIGTTGGSNAISTFAPGPSGVPEPATWAMMLIGFAGLGFAFRQSRRKVPIA